MKIKQTIERIPGGLMVVPLLLGVTLNTLDQAHLGFIESGLKAMGTSPTRDGHYEFLRIGGFAESLFKNGALTLIALFLVCAASQMNLRMGTRALKKGVVLTGSKYAVGLAAGFAFGLFFDPFQGFLGLSTLAIVAAMTNSNGGLYVALTELYGNRSDVGAVAVLSLNDGPFFTLIGLGLMGANFPWVVFLAIFVPIGIGMLLGNLDSDIRTFLSSGEKLLIPFFAFALGTGMSFGVFADYKALAGGLVLGAFTTLLTGGIGILCMRAVGERSTIAGAAEGSTAGNATGTPLAVTQAADAAAKLGLMAPEIAARYRGIQEVATMQITIACLTTAILCPLLVIWWNKRQIERGIVGTAEA